MSTLTPIESEFSSTEEAEEYDRWFRAKVEKALDSKAPRIPHDEAMARVRRLMEQGRHAASRLD